MKFKAMTTILTLVLVAGVVALTLSLSQGEASVSASSARNGELHVIKECSQNNGAAGDFCTITSSNLPEIVVGSRIYYRPVAVPSVEDDVTVGRCTLDGMTNLGLCTLSDGTGQFTGFHARVDVSTSYPNCVVYQ